MRSASTIIPLTPLHLCTSMPTRPADWAGYSHPQVAFLQTGDAVRFQYCPESPFVLALLQGGYSGAWRRGRTHCVRVLLLYLATHLKTHEWDWIFNCCQWTFLQFLVFTFIYFIWYWYRKELASIYHLQFEFPCVTFIVWQKVYIFLL